MAWYSLKPSISLQEPEGASLEICCSDISQLERWNLKNTQGKFCCPGKKTGYFHSSLSGMISKPFDQIILNAQNTLENYKEVKRNSPFVAGSHNYVKIFPLPGKAPGSVENGLGYGQKWPELLAKYNHDSHSWRTHQCSLLGDLELFSETWPKWGIMQDGVCWELTTPERRTEESEYGYWPTPCKAAEAPTWGATRGQAQRDCWVQQS